MINRNNINKKTPLIIIEDGQPVGCKVVQYGKDVHAGLGDLVLIERKDGSAKWFGVTTLMLEAKVA